MSKPQQRLYELVGPVDRLEIFQGSPKWHQERLGRFTGSNAYKLLSQPRSKADKAAGKLGTAAISYTREKVWERLADPGKMIDDIWPDFATRAMRYGSEQETYAVEALEKKIGQVIAPGAFYADEEGHIGASPDGRLDDGNIIEVKCPYSPGKSIEYREAIPDQYYFQMQWNMLLTGASLCYFVVFDPRLMTPFQLWEATIFEHEETQNKLLDGLERCMAYAEELENQMA